MPEIKDMKKPSKTDQIEEAKYRLLVTEIAKGLQGIETATQG